MKASCVWRYRYLLFFMCICFVLLSCSNGNGKAGNLSNDGFNVEEAKPGDDGVDSISFLKLEEPERGLFACVSKLKMLDDEIYVFDKYVGGGVYVFDKDGNYKFTVGARGRAANEYVKLWDFDVNPRNIVLYDRAGRKMMWYSKDGVFSRYSTTDFLIDGFKCLEDGSFLVSIVKDQSLRRVCIADTMLNITGTLLEYDEDYVDDKVTDNLFQCAEDVILYNKPVNNYVYEFSYAGGLIRKVYFDFSEKNVPDDLMNSYQKLLKDNGKKKYTYLYDCPMKVGKAYICPIFDRGVKKVLKYDSEKKTVCLKDLENGVRSTDMILPVLVHDNMVVGWMDMSVYERIENKDELPGDIARHLEDGGKVLVYYHIKEKE